MCKRRGGGEKYSPIGYNCFCLCRKGAQNKTGRTAFILVVFVKRNYHEKMIYNRSRITRLSPFNREGTIFLLRPIIVDFPRPTTANFRLTQSEEHETLNLGSWVRAPRWAPKL